MDPSFNDDEVDFRIFHIEFIYIRFSHFFTADLCERLEEFETNEKDVSVALKKLNEWKTDGLLWTLPSRPR